MMTSQFVYVSLLVMVLTAAVTEGTMYRKPPSKTIHVHHYDAGMTNEGHSSNYKKGGGHGGGSSSLIELLILSSLLGGGGLFGNNNANAGIPIGIPIQQGVVPAVGR